MLNKNVLIYKKYLVLNLDCKVKFLLELCVFVILNNTIYY